VGVGEVGFDGWLIVLFEFVVRWFDCWVLVVARTWRWGEVGLLQFRVWVGAGEWALRGFLWMCGLLVPFGVVMFVLAFRLVSFVWVGVVVVVFEVVVLCVGGALGLIFGKMEVLGGDAGVMSAGCRILVRSLLCARVCAVRGDYCGI